MYHRILLGRCPISTIILMTSIGWYNYIRMVSINTTLSLICHLNLHVCGCMQFTALPLYLICNVHIWKLVIILFHCSCEISYSNADHPVSLPQQEAGMGVASCKSFLFRQSIFPTSRIHYFHQCITEVCMQ